MTPDPADTPTRPADACVLCRPPGPGAAWTLRDAGYQTCRDCWRHLRRQLGEIVDRYARLNPRPGAGGGHTERGAPGFAASPAANLHIVAMRDWRSRPDARVWRGGDGRVHTEAERPPLSVFAELHKIALGVIRARGFDHGHEQTTVAGLCWWLDHQLEWVTAQPDVTRFAAHLRRLLAQLKPATGDERFWVARCPNTIDLGETTRTCDAPLYAPRRGNSIRCGACGREWVRDKWEAHKGPDSLARLVADKRKQPA